MATGLQIYPSPSAAFAAITGDPTDNAELSDKLATYKYRTAIQTVLDATLANDNALFITAPAAGVYHFRFELFMRDLSFGSTDGIDLAIAGLDVGLATVFVYEINTGTFILLMQIVNSSVFTAIGYQDFKVVIDGIAEMDGIADFQLQFACGSAGSSGVRDNKYSSLEWIKIA